MIKIFCALYQFVEVVGDYFDKVIWPSIDDSDTLKNAIIDKNILSMKLEENETHKCKERLKAINGAINAANQWGTNVKDRKYIFFCVKKF